MTSAIQRMVFFILAGTSAAFGPVSFEDAKGDVEYAHLDWRSGMLGLDPNLVWATLDLNGDLEFEGTLYYCFVKLREAESSDRVYVMQLREGQFEAHYTQAGETMVPVPHNQSLATGNQIRFRAARLDSGLPFTTVALICRAQPYPDTEGATFDDISYSESPSGENANASGSGADIPTNRLLGSITGAIIACGVARRVLRY